MAVVEAESVNAQRPTLMQAPVTLAISLAWTVIFVLLCVSGQGNFSIRGMLWGGFIDLDTSHAFGDVTPLNLYGGQFWRALTATFVHFNVLHLLLNLIAFVQLGRIVESWYGSWQFLGLYVALGILANLGANLLRPWLLGTDALVIHSGGGSTVVLGLIGLVAVVGWRNPSEFPGRAGLWMVAILLANGLLGLLVPHIDNLGHAAGAVAGGLFGLLDRRLIRSAPKRRAKIIGSIGMIVMIGAFAAQATNHRAEATVMRRATRSGDAEKVPQRPIWNYGTHEVRPTK